MKVGLVYGSWGQNIGNAFFNLGGRRVLEGTFGEENVKLVQDQPAYSTFRNQSKGNWDNAYNLIGRLEVDLLVMQGPLFTRNFGNIWGPTLEMLHKRAVHWGVLGAGLRKYNDDEFALTSRWLQKYPPLFISTRDRDTYKRLSTIERPGFALHDGLDSAFYLPYAYQPAAIDNKGHLVCFTFDHFPEPQLRAASNGPIQIGDRRYDAHSGKLRTWMAGRSKASGIISHATHPRGPSSINGSTVVRPNHRVNPHLPSVIYRQPNAIAWDEPYTYLTIYNAAELTLSDRVHACVATLAYGAEAMLFNPTTKRSAVFERAGCSSIDKRPVSLDLSMVENELHETQRFLSSVV